MGLTTLIKRGAKRVRALRNSPKLNIRWKSRNRSKTLNTKRWRS